MMNPDQPLSQGTLLENRYRIRGLLGQGGMSRVYLADAAHLNIQVAVKENIQTSVEARTQFEREAQMLARLSHPNIPRVLDSFTDATTGRQYLVMEYVEGEDLAAMIKRVGTLPEATALNWIRQILGAVEYLHGQRPPVIHRDIKPANIKISPQGKAMLVDFGIAKVYDPSSGTMLGARATTPGYAAPEQYGMRTTERSDIYSLGATLYKILTGRVPPEAPLRQWVGEVLVPPQRLASVSVQTSNAIVRAMELEGAKRWQTASELRAALEGRTIVAPPPLPHQPPRSSLIVPLLLAGAIVIGIICVLSVLLFSGGGTWLIALLASPTPTPTNTPIPTATSTSTGTPIPTRTPTMTPTLTPVPGFSHYSPIRIRDQISKVKQYYGISNDPIKYESQASTNVWMYDLSTYGILIFFNAQFSVTTIRYTEPFDGKIDGIAIGDTRDKVIQLKGQPIRTFDFGGDDAWVYDPGGEFVRYDFDRTNSKVIRIFK